MTRRYARLVRSASAHRGALLSGALLSGVMFGCAPTKPAESWAGDEYFKRRDYPGAIVAYRVQLEEPHTRTDREVALLNLSYAYQSQGDSTSLRRAEQILEQLLSLHPGTTSARIAEQSLNRLRQLTREQAVKAQLQIELARHKTLIYNYRSQAQQLSLRIQQQHQALEAANTERNTLVREMELVKSRLKQQELQVEALEKQLDALKRIDLGEGAE